MAINKLHDEFHPVDMKNGWEVPPGYPPGIQQKMLSGSIDDKKKTGFRTRLLRFEAGEYTTAPFVHDHWEEVFLVSGDLTVGNDAQGNGGVKFAPNTYACRPPGAVHGPFKSEGGCLLLEQHYYDWTAKPKAKAKPARAKAAPKKVVAKKRSAKKAVAKRASKSAKKTSKRR